MSLASLSPPLYPVSSRIRNRDQVMYYTLKQRPAFRHDSTEGPWVMRQTYILGAQPDVHRGSAVPVAADEGTPKTGRMRNMDLFCVMLVKYLCLHILL